MNNTCTTSTLIAIFFVGCSFAELFTAIEEFRVTLDAQKHIARELKTFISAEEERLQNILKLAADYERESLRSGDEIVKVVSNPVNAYHVAKRFQEESLRIQALFNNTEIVNASLTKLEPYRKHLPSKEDFIGSINALIRLQDTYRITPSMMADGVLPQVTNTSRLSVADCYEIGRAAYNSSDYYHTAIWMQEAYNRLRHEPSTPGVDKAEILGYLAFAVYQQGNLERALELTKELIATQPNHPHAWVNKEKMERELKLREQPKKGDTGKDWGSSIGNEHNLNAYLEAEEYQSYERLCRGECIKPRKDAHKLTCDYARNNDPRLLIAPMKREMLHLDPWIFTYYDVISDKEINFFKEIALAKFTRSVGAPVSSIRIRKDAWLNNKTDNVVTPRLLNRISAMTQLTLEYAQDLRVANYGFGGFFKTHYDFALPEESAYSKEGHGNPLLTSLFYLTDVAAGGATVFPSLGLQLKPVKGAVVMWFNLLKSGEGDMTLRHGACPVLVGNKWVIVKLLNVNGNEFWHKCTKNSTERFSLTDLEHATPSYHRARGRFSFNL